MSSVILIYSRNLNISSESALKQGFPLRGESLFVEKGKEGEIIVQENGDYSCETSGLKGSLMDFLMQLNPTFTEAGAKQAIAIEGKDEPELDLKRLESNLSHFHSEKGEADEFEYICNVSPSAIKDESLWLDRQGNYLHYAQRSNTGHPLCRYSWKPGARNELLFGVPRIKLPGKADRIWFVEDHLQAVLVRQLTHEPVFLRPCEKSLEWNDYGKLVDGRHVVCLQGDDEGEYSYSSYPLINAVSSKAKQWTNLHYRPVTGGIALPKWLAKEKGNIGKLMQEVEEASGRVNQMVTRQMYESFIGDQELNRLHFPQDSAGDVFWYGTREGNLVHSTPVNRLDPADVLSKKNLQVAAVSQDQIQAEGIRLTDSEILNIHSSKGQFTPQRAYRLLKDLIDRHVYFPNEHISSLVALWIIGGYVYKLFSAYGYLRLNGRYGTGKTTLLDIICNCGFNGVKENDMTKSSFAETVHFLSCTFCMDETEEKSEFTKPHYVELLKAGYKKDGRYSKKSGKSIIKLDVYSPKVISSIDPLADEALESRTLKIKTTLKPQNEFREKWDIDSGDTLQEVTLVRRGCYTFGLYHHKAIERFYRRVPPGIDLPSGMTLDNRRRQIVAPLIAVAQLIDINGSSNAENSLLKALDAIWNPEYIEAQKSMILLYEQLCQWSEDPSFVEFRVENDMLYLDNKLFKNTSIAKHLGSQPKVLAWLNTVSGVLKDDIYLKYFKNNRSCTVFPLDLKVHKKTVREIFSSKKGVE